MPLYNIVDHRAPVWFPHKAENHLNDAMIWIPLMIGGILALAVGLPLLFVAGLWYLTFLLPFIFLGWYRHCRRWIYPIQRVGGLKDYNFNEAFEKVQSLYRHNPGVREELEPLITSCYKFIPTLDTEAIHNRRVLMQKIVDDQPTFIIERTDDELEQFKKDVEIRTEVRRQMREEGLL